MTRRSYTPVGKFPDSYRFLRVGDTCIFKATNFHHGWHKGMEVNGVILRIYLQDKFPSILISVDPTKHNLQSRLYMLYPKGTPEFDFYLKVKGTGLGSKLRQRAREERDGIFQGDLILPFGK
ncbi:hypothetical protein D3C87_601170 [compost metagenome]